MVAVSSMDYSVSNQSNLEISFCNEELCPGHIFFNCSNGSAIAFKNPLNDMNITISEPPEINSKLNSTISSSSSRIGMSYSLTDEFIVTLRIFYDDAFVQEFGSNSEARLNIL